LETAHKLVESLAEKKGEKIVLLDIQEVASFTDYFIICSGTSDRKLNALSDAVAQCAKKDGGLPARVEGVSDYGWVVVDCGDIVVHLFSPTQREYYRLEALWEKGKTLIRLQ
jgi:ribosome-associated protein